MKAALEVYCREILNGDGSITLYHRFVDAVSGQERQQKVVKTEPNPGTRSMRKWRRTVRELALYAKHATMGGEGRTPGIIWTPLRDGLAQYLDWLRADDEYGRPNGAGTTILAKERIIGDFIAFIEAIQVFPRGKDAMHKVILYHVSRWRDESLIPQKLQAGTINTHLAFVSAWFQWGIDHGYCIINPLHSLKRRKAAMPARIVPIQTPDQLRKLLCKIELPNRKAIIMLLATTGIRQGELKSLIWADWNQQKRTLHIRPSATERTKRHERTLPLCNQATAALERLKELHADSALICPQEQNHAKSMTIQINAWLKPLGVRPHDLRRFFYSSMEGVGAPSRIVDDLVGHCADKTRAAYTTPVSRTARKWIIAFGKWLAPADSILNVEMSW